MNFFSIIGIFKYKLLNLYQFKKNFISNSLGQSFCGSHPPTSEASRTAPPLFLSLHIFSWDYGPNNNYAIIILIPACKVHSLFLLLLFKHYIIFSQKANSLFLCSNLWFGMIGSHFTVLIFLHKLFKHY